MRRNSGVRRFRNVEVHEARAGLEHAPDLAQRRADVDDVAHREAHRRAVERCVAERQRHDVAEREGDARAARSARAARFSRAVEHRPQKSTPSTLQRRVGAGEVERKVARPAAQVENAPARGRRQLAHGAAPPAFVDAAGEEPVGRIVAGRDRCEHLADVDGLLHA